MIVPTSLRAVRSRPWPRPVKKLEPCAAAIDRLVRHSIILELNVASYRLEQSKKNKARAAKTVENKEME